MNTLLNICSHANCFAGYLGLKTAWGDVCGTMTTFDSFCSQQNQSVDVVIFYNEVHRKGWLGIAKLKPLSLFISLLLMLKKAFDNVIKEK